MGNGIYVVDAFTDRPFAGNPAAICLLKGCDRDGRWMQSLAAEMNLSETAFLHRPSRLADWVLRWFTPTVEVDLCGHATLASAHVLWNELGHSDEVLNFQTRSGLLRARRQGDRIALDFPADPPASATPPPGLSEALGASPQWVGRSGSGWVAVLESARCVRNLQPDLARLADLGGTLFMATAPSDDPAFDFISRVFAPAAGIPEEPVTGSAHCTLAVLWSERLGRSALRGYQASRRGGTVAVHCRGDRVELSGRARTILNGKLRV